jgi:glycerophosphoryl diester phosphodiesterase
MTNNPWRRSERPITISHRGHSIAYPENTRIAYEKAIALGCEMIECDVNITSDGVLVMMHDSTLNRTTNGTGRVSASSWNEVQRLDAGAKFKPEFAGTPVPLTEDTLLFYREAGIYGCFEVKGGDQAESNRIAVALVDLFVKHNALDYALMSGYSHEALALAKARVPELMLAPERLPDDTPADLDDIVRQAQNLGTQIMQHQYTVLDDKVMAAYHGIDVAVWSWTVNSEQSLIDSINLGADGLMGDDMITMMTVLNRMRPAKAVS